jgi:hypothetical protein
VKGRTIIGTSNPDKSWVEEMLSKVVDTPVAFQVFASSVEISELQRKRLWGIFDSTIDQFLGKSCGVE